MCGIVGSVGGRNAAQVILDGRRPRPRLDQPRNLAPSVTVE
jgi:glucosamine 6-phosphate synthetase-like amidotransferase/phosphosugar isomerase protein